MPRKCGKVPAYCHHKASDRAVVRIDGRDHYLGPFGSGESHANYERLIAEWRAQQKQAAAQKQQAATNHRFDQSITDVIGRYRDFARSYYVKDGQTTKEFTEMKYALRPLRKLYGDTFARDFGPLALRAVRQTMLDDDLSRGVINHRIKRIKRFFKWAVSQELVPPSVYEGVRTVEPLRYGRTEARETEPVRPVPDVWVDATLAFMSPPVAAMVQLQRLTGMRPCEVVSLRACEIDMSDEIWLYELLDHKNRWREHRRVIPIGPKAQEVVKPFLSLKTDACLFSPRAAESWRNEERRKARKTPMTPSQSARKAKAQPARTKRDHYDVDSYRRAITYAIKKANRQRAANDQIPHWFPLQLRHSRGTEVRREFGIEGAQVSLGHAHARVTEVYAERNLKLAIEIARKSG